VLFLDLDNFKTVNDSLGHHAGDQLLCEVADRLAGAVGHADLVARQGGDEFVVLLTGTGGQEDAARVAGKLLDLFGTPMLINGHKVAVSCSIGIGLFPGDGVTADELIRHADVAM
jgi:diguanylate cyclase (GGDEF)-like protein